LCSHTIQKIHSISLPSFARRTNKTALLKAQISLSGAKLSRVGRSRNWQLQANFEQLHRISLFIEEEQEHTWTWLLRLFKSNFQVLTHNELLDIADALKDLTLSSLMAATDCTLAQARKVLDDLEMLG
jgi:type VI protein secretion system component VasK